MAHRFMIRLGVLGDAASFRLRLPKLPSESPTVPHAGPNRQRGDPLETHLQKLLHGAKPLNQPASVSSNDFAPPDLSATKAGK